VLDCVLDAVAARDGERHAVERRIDEQHPDHRQPTAECHVQVVKLAALRSQMCGDPLHRLTGEGLRVDQRKPRRAKGELAQRVPLEGLEQGRDDRLAQVRADRAAVVAPDHLEPDLPGKQQLLAARQTDVAMDSVPGSRRSRRHGRAQPAARRQRVDAFIDADAPLVPEGRDLAPAGEPVRVPEVAAHVLDHLAVRAGEAPVQGQRLS
jgi:hypothetical protein